MDWITCFILSLLCVIGSIATAFWINKQDKKLVGFFTPYRIVFLGLYLGVVLALLPVYLLLLTRESVSGFKSILLALYNAFQVFTTNTDGGLILENIHQPGNPIDDIYFVYISFLFIIAPIMTFTFLVSLLKNVIPALRYSLVHRRDTYAFSALNERSLSLARDLKQNDPRRVILFANVDADEISTQLMKDAETLHAICFRGDLTTIDMQCRKERKLILFAVDDDIEENSRLALRLINQYGMEKQATLYLFANDAVSELLLPQLRNKAMTIRRVNETQILVDDLLYHRGTELFASAVPSGAERVIHAVFVGMGQYAAEMLKALTWYAQMDGYRLEIDAYDVAEDAADRFAAQCPELMDARYNGRMIPGEAQYRIAIHNNVSLDSSAMIREITGIQDASYCFVDLGSDALNIEASLKLRMLFERGNTKPVIHAVVKDSGLKQMVENSVHFSGKSYNITGVGDVESLYTEAVVINNQLQQEALACHMRWGEEPAFWQYEYHYRSSIASAIHMRARIACGIPGADKPEDKLTPEDRIRLEQLEHRRWNAYMRSIGYVYSGSQNKETRNDLAKMHNNLVCYDELSEDVKRKDSRVGLS